MLSHRHIALVGLTIVILTLQLTFATEPEEAFTPPEGLRDGWYARIDTSDGRIIARLLPEQSPQSVAHFTALADGRMEWFDFADGEVYKRPYYDGIRVHRALAGRHFEVGDHRGTGRGAPDILVPLEGLGPVNFSQAGRLGMTREGARVSGVVFFVTGGAEPWLNGHHPCFGVVISGLDVAQRISQVKTYSNDRPVDPPYLERVRIFSVGEPAALPEPGYHREHRIQFKARPEVGQTEPK